MSEWVDLCGRVRIQTTDGRTRVHRLLSEMMPPFAALNRQYFDRTTDQAFAYGEKQLHSILLPALRDVAGVVFLEQPVTRGRGSSRTDGWVDYWIEQGNSVILMELKHGFLNVGTGSLTKDERKKWEDLREQVNTLVTTGGPSLMASGDHAMVVGLFAVVHSATGDFRDAEAAAPDACWARHCALLKTLSDRRRAPITWSALWLVPNDMQLDQRSEPTRTYPALSFYATTAQSHAG